MKREVLVAALSRAIDQTSISNGPGVGVLVGGNEVGVGGGGSKVGVAVEGSGVAVGSSRSRNNAFPPDAAAV